MFDEEPDGDPHGECAAEIHRLRDALADAAAHLIAATSAYRTYANRAAKFGRPPADAFYGTRSGDFEAAADRASDAVRRGKPTAATDAPAPPPSAHATPDAPRD